MTHLGFILILLILSFGVSAQTIRHNAVFDNAVIAARNGDHINALSGFKKALIQAKMDGGSDEFLSQVHFNIGVCLFQLERPNEAIAEYRESIRLNAEYERAYYSLGMAALHASELNEAENAFLNAIKLNAKNGEAWFDLAFVYIARNDQASARNAFDNALKFNTRDIAISHNNIGVIAAVSGDIDEAEMAFKRAIKVSDGKLAAAVSNLAVLSNGKDRLVAKLEFTRGETNE